MRTLRRPPYADCLRVPYADCLRQHSLCAVLAWPSGCFTAQVQNPPPPPEDDIWNCILLTPSAYAKLTRTAYANWPFIVPRSGCNPHSNLTPSAYVKLTRAAYASSLRGLLTRTYLRGPAYADLRTPTCIRQPAAAHRCAVEARRVA